MQREYKSKKSALRSFIGCMLWVGSDENKAVEAVARGYEMKHRPIRRNKRRNCMERTIKILGKGKIAVKPDMIRFNIVSTGLCKEYEDTVKKSTEDIRILKESIEKAGLDSKSLKTVHFDINSEYENYSDKDNNYKRRFIGYKYTHNLYIQFPNDNELLGKVLYQFANNSVKPRASRSWGFLLWAQNIFLPINFHIR